MNELVARCWLEEVGQRWLGRGFYADFVDPGGARLRMKIDEAGAAHLAERIGKQFVITVREAEP